MAHEAAAQPVPPTNESTVVACDLLTLIQLKLDLVARLTSCRRHARVAGDGVAMDLLDRMRCHDLKDIELLVTLASGTVEAQAVRQWLADAWRHGEVVAEANGCQPAEDPRLVDRFSISPPRVAAPAADAVGQATDPVDELGP
jgi:hypothetical protein